MAGDNRAAGLTGRGLRQAPAPCRRRLRRTARARTRSSRAGTPRARNQGRIAGPWAGTPRFPAAPGHGLEYLRNCLLRTRTEIEYSILAAVEDAQAGVDDVVEMDVVARPHAVAAYGRRLAVERGGAAAPARRVHAGPVHVAETQDRVPYAGRCAHRTSDGRHRGQVHHGLGRSRAERRRIETPAAISARCRATPCPAAPPCRSSSRRWPSHAGRPRRAARPARRR